MVRAVRREDVGVGQGVWLGGVVGRGGWEGMVCGVRCVGWVVGCRCLRGLQRVWCCLGESKGIDRYMRKRWEIDR